MRLKKFMPASLITMTIITAANSMDFEKIMSDSPVITINNDESGQMKSITVYSVINAPFNVVWDTVRDVSSLKEYVPKIERITIPEALNKKEDELIADFEIEVPIFNIEYRLRYKFNREAKQIDVDRLNGDLEGSRWTWKFEERGNKTVVIYSGIIKNYSSFLESFEDDNKSISIGVNISTLVSTVRYTKERSEFLYKNKYALKPPSE